MDGHDDSGPARPPSPRRRHRCHGLTAIALLTLLAAAAPCSHAQDAPQPRVIASPDWPRYHTVFDQAGAPTHAVLEGRETSRDLLLVNTQTLALTRVINVPDVDAISGDSTTLLAGTFLIDTATGNRIGIKNNFNNSADRRSSGLQALLSPRHALATARKDDARQTRLIDPLTGEDLQGTQLSTADNARRPFAGPRSQTLAQITQTDAGQLIVSLFDARGQARGQPLPLPTPDHPRILAHAWSPDGQRLAIRMRTTDGVRIAVIDATHATLQRMIANPEFRSASELDGVGLVFIGEHFILGELRWLYDLRTGLVVGDLHQTMPSLKYATQGFDMPDDRLAVEFTREPRGWKIIAFDPPDTPSTPPLNTPRITTPADPPGIANLPLVRLKTLRLGRVRAIAQAPAGGHALVLTGPNHGPSLLRRVNAQTLAIDWTQPTHHEQIPFQSASGLVTSPEGRYAAWKADTRTLVVADTDRDRPPRHIENAKNFGSMKLLALPSNRRAVVQLSRPDKTGTLGLPHARSGRTLTKDLPAQRVIGLSPDARYAAWVTGRSQEQKLELWDLGRYIRLASLELEIPERGIWEPVGIAWSPDGSRLAVLHEKGENRLLTLVDPQARQITNARALAVTSSNPHSDGAVLFINAGQHLLIDGRYAVDPENITLLADLEGLSLGLALNPYGNASRSRGYHAARLDDHRFLIASTDSSHTAVILSTHPDDIEAWRTPTLTDPANPWPTAEPKLLAAPASPQPLGPLTPTPDASRWLAEADASIPHEALAPTTTAAADLLSQPPRVYTAFGQGLKSQRNGHLDQATRLYATSPTTGETSGPWRLPARRDLLAARGRRVLTASFEPDSLLSRVSGFNTLEIYDLTPPPETRQPPADPGKTASDQDYTPTPQASAPPVPTRTHAWRLPQSEKSFPRNPVLASPWWAAWPTDDLVLVMIGDRLHAYSLSASAGLWSIDHVAGTPVPSLDGRVLALVAQNTPWLIDTQTGTPLRKLQGQLTPDADLTRGTTVHTPFSLNKSPWAGFTPDQTHLVYSLPDGLRIHHLAHNTTRSIDPDRTSGLDASRDTHGVFTLSTKHALIDNTLIDLSDGSFGFRYPNRWLFADTLGRGYALANLTANPYATHHAHLAPRRLPRPQDLDTIRQLHQAQPLFDPTTRVAFRITGDAGVDMKALEQAIRPLIFRALPPDQAPGPHPILELHFSRQPGEPIPVIDLRDGTRSLEPTENINLTKTLTINGKAVMETKEPIQLWSGIILPRNPAPEEDRETRDFRNRRHKTIVRQAGYYAWLPQFITAEGKIHRWFSAHVEPRQTESSTPPN